MGPEKAAKYQTIGFAVSSASAEVIADCLLCPMEAVSTKYHLNLIQNINNKMLIKMC
jgi:hypothetical protein